MNRSLLILTLISGLTATAYAQKPNIIHIIADDVGYDDLSCYGAKDIKTPQLDHLAREGKRFTNFYAPNSTCTPTRASLLTGRYTARMNHNTGLPVLWPNTPNGLDASQEIALPRLLKQQGYQTALIGKWHLGHLPQYLPLQHGFDEFFGTPYANDMGPERTANTNSRGFPLMPLMRQNQKLKDLTNPDLAELPAELVREACQFLRRQAKSGKPFYLQYANIETHTPWFIPMGFGGTSQAKAYGDAVEYFDLSVGILMRALQELKLDKNTMVVVTSDNGPIRPRPGTLPDLEWSYGRYGTIDSLHDARHQLRGGKMTDRFEGGTRVSCLVRWPGIVPPNTLNHDIVAGFDLFTTFIELAGGKVPTDRPIDGRNLMPLLQSSATSTNFRTLFLGMSPAGDFMAVRYKNWKLCLPTKMNRWEDPITEPLLFNLDSDLGETADLSKKYPDIVLKLKTLSEQSRKQLFDNQKINDRIDVF